MLPFFCLKERMKTERSQIWKRIVDRLFAEYRRKSAAERQMIDDLLDQIEGLQSEIESVFIDAGGASLCSACGGDCCAKGHNHMTLVNLLSFARRDQLPPAADFSSTCPFLGREGCLLATAQRPYNCITFICDRIEAALSPERREYFYELDRKLRTLYLEVLGRYQRATMAGLLIQEDRHQGQPLLALQSQ